MMTKIINLTFIEGKYGSTPIAMHNGKVILLDKNDMNTLKVKIGDSWDCQFLFEKPTFKVFKPLRITKASELIEEEEKIEKELIPSSYQKDIYDFIENGEGNAVINAVAGSGKTSTLLNILKKIPKDKSVLFLAFNKSIVGELKSRIPKNLSNVTVKTVHGFGVSHLKKKYGSELKSDKYLQYAKRLSEAWDDVSEFGMDDYIRRVIKLTDLGRLNIVKNSSELEEIADKHEIELINGECKRAIDLIRIGYQDVDNIDFTDMIFLPNVHKDIKINQFEYVLVDECQDLNVCQRELMLKALKPGGRFISCGDRQQAVYGFAGADAESFDKLLDIPNTIQLPLSVCYRCDKEIIKLAKEIVPQIKWRDNAPDGIIEENAILDDIKDGDYVLCRNTFPLVRLCIQYLSKGVKASIMGKDIGTNLINMIQGTRNTHMIDVKMKLDGELYKIMRKIIKRNKCSEKEAKQTSQYATYEEKIQVISTISKGLIYAKDVVKKIGDIFSDDSKDGIILSTIHKSKGLENDRVFIIHRELMPAKYATKPWMKVQEKNLEYVAITRARHYLGYIVDFDAYEKNNKPK